MNHSKAPNPPKIMVIRHAEKPYITSVREEVEYEGYAVEIKVKGINYFGEPDPKSLIVKGWQRAGALVRYFDPVEGFPAGSLIETPNWLYASSDLPDPKHLNPSERPVETITPLSGKLSLPINSTFKKKDWQKMTDHALKQTGTVLICWQHQDIPSIAQQILPGNTSVPTWPSDVFDQVWIFTPEEDSYTLTIAFQNLLPGDNPGFEIPETTSSE